MMHSRFLLFLLSFFIVTLSCSSTRHVLPLQRGESRATVAIGGPFTRLGDNYLPLPFLTLGYNRGLNFNLDAEAGLNITALLYRTVTFDAGLNWHPCTQKHLRPGTYISLKSTLSTQFKKETTRFFPQFDFGSYWGLSTRNYIYLGMENWIETSVKRYDGNKQNNHILLNPYVGFIFKNHQWTYSLEARALAINCSNFGRAPKNIGFGKQGIFGLFIGISRDFGVPK